MSEPTSGVNGYPTSVLQGWHSWTNPYDYISHSELTLRRRPNRRSMESCLASIGIDRRRISVVGAGP
jgi:hypothetical protein